MTNLLLINDLPLITAGWRAICHDDPGLDLVGEFPDIPEAAAAIATSAAEVVVMHAREIDAATYDAIRSLVRRFPGCRLLLFTADGGATLPALRAVEAGALASFRCDTPAAQVVAAISAVVADAIVLPSTVRAGLPGLLDQEPGEAERAVLRRLSPREREVLALLGAGLSNVEISRELAVAEATVKKHLTDVLRKVRVRDRLQAGLFARDIGLRAGKGDPSAVNGISSPRSPAVTPAATLPVPPAGADHSHPRP